MGDFGTARELIVRAHPEAAKIDFGGEKQDFYQGRLKLNEELKGRSNLQSAITNAMLGRKDDALRDLNILLDYDAGDLVTWVRRPEFELLHSDPRYQELVRKMKLAQ